MTEDKTIIAKYKKRKSYDCHFCGASMYEAGLQDIEYVKKGTKEIWAHTECMKSSIKDMIRRLS